MEPPRAAWMVVCGYIRAMCAGGSARDSVVVKVGGVPNSERRAVDDDTVKILFDERVDDRAARHMLAKMRPMDGQKMGA